MLSNNDETSAVSHASALVQMPLEADKHPPDLLRIAQIRDGIGNRIVVAQLEQGRNERLLSVRELPARVGGCSFGAPGACLTCAFGVRKELVRLHKVVNREVGGPRWLSASRRSPKPSASGTASETATRRGPCCRRGGWPGDGYPTIRACFPRFGIEMKWTPESGQT